MLTSNPMNKKDKTEQLFEEIFNSNVCGPDSQKVRRNIHKTNINADVLVIAEAMAPGQVRLSGVNYFFPDGTIGSTGKNLEKFLNKLKQTVYPEKENCIYHSEIVHSFPGYSIKANKKTIRKPTKNEIEQSLKMDILKQEIEVIKPRIILLMGDTAYRAFYKHFLKKDPENNLTSEIKRISSGGDYFKYNDIPVFPIQHASGANPRFNDMLKNERLIRTIKRGLS